MEIFFENDHGRSLNNTPLKDLHNKYSRRLIVILMFGLSLEGFLERIWTEGGLSRPGLQTTWAMRPKECVLLKKVDLKKIVYDLSSLF